MSRQSRIEFHKEYDELPPLRVWRFAIPAIRVAAAAAPRNGPPSRLIALGNLDEENTGC
jgi:hypothetical protein